MYISIGKKIAIGYVLTLALYIAMALFSYTSIQDIKGAADERERSHRILTAIETADAGVSKSQSAVRGFAITGNESFLSLYRIGIADYESAMRKMGEMISNPESLKLLQDVNLSTSQVHDYFASEIALARAEGVDAARKKIQTGEGKQLVDTLRAKLNRLQEAQEVLLRTRSEFVTATIRESILELVGGFILALGLSLVAGYLITRTIVRAAGRLSLGAAEVSAGRFEHRIELSSNDELGQLTASFNVMAAQLGESSGALNEREWMQSSLVKLSTLIQGERNLELLAQKLLGELAPLLNCQHGVYFHKDADAASTVFKLAASYGYTERKHLSNSFAPGEGLVGQCLTECQRIVLTDAPADYVRISSGLGEAIPLQIVVQPVLFEGDPLAVLELASLGKFSAIQLELLGKFADFLGVALGAITAHVRTQQLLEQIQGQTEELQVQNEELATTQSALEEKNASLTASEEELRSQQAELRASASQLEENNLRLEQAKEEIKTRAEQLAMSGRYKSEFLANMSHELRTPLNSMLILSKMLTEGKHLPAKELQWARTIHGAGNDLLTLINEILDLAKIESGKAKVEIEPCVLQEIADEMRLVFEPMASEKALGYRVTLDAQLPATLRTDRQRVCQVLKNLLGNAFKFTESGEVELTLSAPAQGGINFAVRDTGMGIAENKRELIFEAFQQVDGSQDRKYGGTGLGLTISRQIVQLLGGTLALQSVPGQGSTFTLWLPSEQAAHVSSKARPMPAPPSHQGAVPALTSTHSNARVPQETLPPAEIPDDRDALQPGDPLLLVIEDDPVFVQILIDLARSNGFKVIAALHGGLGLALASRFSPTAITLDLKLPDMDGWVVLDQLKHDPATRHIPVHIISGSEETQRGLSSGALSVLQKPVKSEDLLAEIESIRNFSLRPLRQLLLVEDDVLEGQSLEELLGGPDVEICIVRTGAQALEQLRDRNFDCMVLDLGLPDMSGLKLIKQLKRHPGLRLLPIVVHTGKDLSVEEANELDLLSRAVVVKSVLSPERLLDETALFLHRVVGNLPETQRRILEAASDIDPILEGRKLLIVDDDVRNIFALSEALGQLGMEVRHAESGQAALDALANDEQIEIVLMDIMMPGMDGLEATRRIRAQERLRTLPVIALTAKTMQGDRESCIEAGASDYIAKPVQIEQLSSVLRVWLHR